MTDVKKLNTRIALKYDSYAAWTDESEAGKGANLKLLKGEIGICEIPAANGASNVAPTVLFKVGAYKKDAEGNDTTELHAFKELPWASAKAADVYNWAKASAVEIKVDKVNDKDVKKLVFKNGVVNEDGTKSDYEVVINYATPEEVTAAVEAVVDEFEPRVAALEAKFSGDTSVEGQIAGLDERLTDAEDAIDAINDDENGILATAKSYVDEREEVITGAYEQYADDAEKAANDYTDAELAKVTEAQAAIDAEQNAKIQGNTEAIASVRTDFETADVSINAKLAGIGGTDEPATVVAAISAAQTAAESTAADYTDEQIDALVDGQIDKINVAITETIPAEIAEVSGSVTTEKERAMQVEGELRSDVDSIKTFFAVEGDEKLDTALDTLKEIQDYLNGEGSATDGMLGRLSQAEKDIDSLQAEFSKEEGKEGRVTKAEADIDTLEGRASALEGRATTLEGQVANLETASATHATKDELTAVDNKFANYVTTDTYTSDKSGIDEAIADRYTKEEVNTLFETEAGEISGIKGRLDTAEGKITALETASDDYALKTDVENEFKNYVKTSDYNTDKDTTTNALNDRYTKDEVDGFIDGISDDIDGLEGEVSNIKNNYVKQADFLIIDCGSSTTNIETL